MTVTYGETGKSISATTNGDGTLSYAVKNGGDYIDVDASTGALTIKKVGTATVTVTAAETDSYTAATKDVTVTVGKAASSVTIAPAANTLTYTGTAQNLVTAGTASGGTLKYAVTESNSGPADSAYSETIPIGIDVKTYYVWYKVVGDSTHSDTEPACVETSIKASSKPSSKVPYEDVEVSADSVKDITGTSAATAESNTFGTKIKNSSDLKSLLSLSDSEVSQGVNVWLDVQDMSSSVSKTDKTLVQKNTGDYTVGLYLDINLFKKVGNNDATKVTETNGKVKASIVIPESLWKSGRTFEVIRVHDGVATVITGTYDESTHVFTFETDKFSTYAIAYKDISTATSSTSSSSTKASSTTTASSTTAKSTKTTKATAPKTNDPNNTGLWYILLLASLMGGLGFLGYSKKKKVND